MDQASLRTRGACHNWLQRVLLSIVRGVYVDDRHSSVEEGEGDVTVCLWFLRTSATVFAQRCTVMRSSATNLNLITSRTI